MPKRLVPQAPTPYQGPPRSVPSPGSTGKQSGVSSRNSCLVLEKEKYQNVRPRTNPSIHGLNYTEKNYRRRKLGTRDPGGGFCYTDRPSVPA